MDLYSIKMDGMVLNIVIKEFHKVRGKISPHKKDAEKSLAIRKTEIIQGKFHYSNEEKSII